MTTLTLTLGHGGSAYAHLIEGWSGAEPDFRWSLGAGAALTADIPPGEGELFLEISLDPFKPPGQRSRPLRITVDGRTIGTDSLVGQGIVGYPVPPDIAGPRARVALHHEAAPSPATLGLSADSRSLGFMVRFLRLTRQPYRPATDLTVLPPLDIPFDSLGQRRAVEAITGLTPSDLAERFESLGHNCEFGIVQRQLGAEPLGLLRFAGIALDRLLDALDQDFAGIGTDFGIRTHPFPNGALEYVVTDRRYQIDLHTTRTTETASKADIEAQYRVYFPFLAKHLRGHLAAGSHIHVFQRPGQLTHSQAVPLWNRLRARGPNALLYIDQEPDLPSGAVEQRGYGLFHGKLARMAPQNDVDNVDLPAWLSLLANTHRLWARQRRT